MRVFQVMNIYPPFIPYLESKYSVENLSFEEHRALLLKSRFHALHILSPCLENEGNGFFTMWGYENLQYKWARENGLKTKSLKEILFAQIKKFKPDVFYNFSTDNFSKEELDLNLSPSIIRICWSAAPFRNPEFFKLYATRLTNYPEDILLKEKVGYRNDLFQPAYDDEMSVYAQNDKRPIDLFFYGQYTKAGFDNRNKRLEALLLFKKNNPHLNIKLCLQYIEKEHIYVNIPYIRRYLRRIDFPPKIVRKYSSAPIYGLDLYDAISQSKIVFNAGVDFTKNYKVNMRNFEVLGCGAHMISDAGIYPEGFEMGKHFSTYHNMEECFTKIKALLQNDAKRKLIAQVGHEMVRKQYSKEQQWKSFKKIVESL